MQNCEAYVEKKTKILPTVRFGETANILEELSSNLDQFDLLSNCQVAMPATNLKRPARAFTCAQPRYNLNPPTGTNGAKI